MSKTIYIQFTAGKGPTECAVACERVLDHFCDLYIDSYFFRVVSMESDDDQGIRSVIIQLPEMPEERIIEMKQKWEGTVRFIARRNSIRPEHKRKNWYIGVNFFEEPKEDLKLTSEDLKWETMRSHGPGGQHVNVTESAVRVTHLPTGISVRCDAGRSQIKNKEIALNLLKSKLDALNKTSAEERKNLIWMNHNSVERGNEVMTIKGDL